MGRLVITQKGRDVRRVAASLSAYLVLGVLALAAVILMLAGVAVAYSWVA